MDNSDEDNNNGEDFQLVTRKRRGKGKNARTHSAKDSDVESQSVGSNNFRYTSGQGRCRNVNRGYINYGEPFCDEIDVAERVSLKDIVDVIRLDAALTQPPRYNEEKPEEDKSEPKIPHGNDQESRPVIEKINTRFLAKEAATYELEKFEKNAMLIFNHTNVDGYSLPRLGTEKDVAELERTFTNFGFEVAVKHDLKKYQIMEKLKEFTSQDFTDYGCVAVVVLSHGSNDGRIRAKDMPYSELDIVNQLLVRNKPTLVTKPRLFIVQACRGTQNIRGVPVGYADRIQKDTEEEVETYTLPVESDMLVLHSSYIGKPSHRDELDGSWFIQTLCRKINQRSANADLLTILTEVNREVAIDKSHKVLSRVTDEYDINKQMPAFTSTLTRGLYLRRYGSPSPGLESVSDGGACAHSRAVTDNSMPSTPMTLSASCACFLDHFEYIKNCLSLYLLAACVALSAVVAYNGPDLPPGPFCRSYTGGIECCRNRQDSCSHKILDTVCYCDEFCNRTHDDCCPDYEEVCGNPQPPPAPEPQGRGCEFQGRTYYPQDKVLKDCNTCQCETIRPGVANWTCEHDVCLISSEVLNGVNRGYERSWRAANYSEFQGKKLKQALTYKLGTLPLSRETLRMGPLRHDKDIPYPLHFDAREAWPGYISPVVDQGWCGSDWAVAIAGVTSDRFAIQSNGAENLVLAPQSLLSCNNRMQRGCDGGYVDVAWNFAKNQGLVDERCYPYQAQVTPCRLRVKGSLKDAGCRPPVPQRTSRYKVGPPGRLTREQDIMYDIMQSGPVHAVMTVYQDFFHYRDGVYHRSGHGNSNLQGLHSVRIVGWGEDRGEKYWIVANSWGTWWGEDGYFRIRRGNNESGIESFVVTVLADVTESYKRK